MSSRSAPAASGSGGELRDEVYPGGSKQPRRAEPITPRPPLTPVPPAARAGARCPGTPRLPCGPWPRSRAARRIVPGEPRPRPAEDLGRREHLVGCELAVDHLEHPLPQVLSLRHLAHDHALQLAKRLRGSFGAAHEEERQGLDVALPPPTLEGLVGSLEDGLPGCGGCRPRRPASAAPLSRVAAPPPARLIAGAPTAHSPTAPSSRSPRKTAPAAGPSPAAPLPPRPAPRAPLPSSPRRRRRGSARTASRPPRRGSGRPC